MLKHFKWHHRTNLFGLHDPFTQRDNVSYSLALEAETFNAESILRMLKEVWWQTNIILGKKLPVCSWIEFKSVEEPILRNEPALSLFYNVKKKPCSWVFVVDWRYYFLFFIFFYTDLIKNTNRNLISSNFTRVYLMNNIRVPKCDFTIAPKNLI